MLGKGLERQRVRNLHSGRGHRQQEQAPRVGRTPRVKSFCGASAGSTCSRSIGSGAPCVGPLQETRALRDITWQELALVYFARTHVVPAHPAHGQRRTVRQMARFLADASRGVQRLMHIPLWQGREDARASSLVPLGLRRVAGLTIRPRLRKEEETYVVAILRARKHSKLGSVRAYHNG